MWYGVLIVSICGGLFLAAVLPNSSVQQFITQAIEKDHPSVNGVESKDMKEWKEFVNAPLAAKIFMFPYGAAVVVLLLLIIKKSKLLFENFRREIVFNKNNVEIMSGINKLLIWFSIITFNFSGLLTCVMLFMLIEIFRNGAALQEEHDLTV